MRATLTPHQTTPCPFIESFEVVIQRGDSRTLVAGFVITGDVERILIPAPAAPERTEGLWEHTCFEIFLHPHDSHAYFEFNFCPSTQWAAYRFDDYRSGMKELSMPAVPRIFHDESMARVMDIEAAVDLKALRSFAANDIKLGACAVIEDRDGRKSYWAMRHPSSKPDFHHRDAGALLLPGTGGQG